MGKREEERWEDKMPGKIPNINLRKEKRKLGKE